jgi:hypothetical protein
MFAQPAPKRHSAKPAISTTVAALLLLLGSKLL